MTGCLVGFVLVSEFGISIDHNNKHEDLVEDLRFHFFINTCVHIKFGAKRSVDIERG